MTSKDIEQRGHRDALLLVLVALFAFALREHFVLMSVAKTPIAGDIRQYVSYAWNLVEHGVFSSTIPGTGEPQPDSFRFPGYPWLLALGMLLFPQSPAWAELSGWYQFVQQVQVLLGTATVVLASLLVRRWTAPGWGLVAGLLLAIWPHHVVASAVLMPEVLFGFLLVAALYVFDLAWQTRRPAWFIATGAVLALATLVNPLLALFPPALAAVLAVRRERRGAAWLLGVFLVPLVAVAVRNSSLEGTGAGTTSNRAALNLVQGSWPDYHAAHGAVMWTDPPPQAIAIMREIDAETRLLERRPAAGIARLLARLGNDPGGYAAWYLIHKPWLLWDWDIRLGAGGFYLLDVERSPYERSAVLRALADGMRLANPVLSACALAGMVALALFGWRRQEWVPAAIAGALCSYFTLMHMLLQAEPRYAIAYRGIEVVVVATALSLLARAIQEWPALSRRGTDAPRQL